MVTKLEDLFNHNIFHFKAPLGDIWKGGYRVRWFIFCVTLQFFCKVSCIYMVLIYHKVNNMSNL